MPPLPRLRLLFTGGTISMRDDAGRGAVPALDGADLVRVVPGLTGICRPEVVEFGRYPGPHMRPSDMMRLAAVVRESFEAGFDGCVITHGTDTLEETACLLDLLHEGEQPVVLVGAMRPADALSWDGPVNLFQACQVAAHPKARGKGVLVAMNSTINAAAEVTKTYTEALDTFQSPDTGALGIVDGDEVIFYRGPVRRRHIAAARLEERVRLVAASAGDDGALIRYVVEHGDRGLVIEALGRGNLPPPMAKEAVRAVEAGLTVMLTSRCWGGRVRGAYGYEGGGARLREAGLVFAPGLPGHKARIILMAALGAGMNAEEIKAWLA